MARPAFSVGGVKDAINDSFSRMRRGWESLDMDAKVRHATATLECSGPTWLASSCCPPTLP